MAVLEPTELKLRYHLALFVQEHGILSFLESLLFDLEHGDHLIGLVVLFETPGLEETFVLFVSMKSGGQLSA